MENSSNSIPNARLEYRRNPEKKIRGLSAKRYAKEMHRIERGEVSEKTLVRQKILLPGKGIGLNRDDKIFHFKSNVKGRKNAALCTVPSCANEPSRRGMCNTHRVYARRMIKLGKATEKNLMNRGLLLSTGNAIKRSTTKSEKPRVTGKLTIHNAKHCLFPECNNLRKMQGLCHKHYKLYLKKTSKLNSTDKKKLEKDLIRRKLLLPKPLLKEEDAFQLGSKIKGIIHR